MWDLFVVAFRNVRRNTRRTAITVLTIFLGVVVITAVRGLLNGLQGEIRDSLTRKVNGDLQLRKEGSEDALEIQPFKLSIPYDEARRAQVQELGLLASPRLRAMGLLNHQKTQTTTPVALQAYDTQNELAVCPRLADALLAGRLIDPAREPRVHAQVTPDTDLEEAVPLEKETTAEPAAGSQEGKTADAGGKAQKRAQALVTPSLLRGLGAALGDEIVLLLQDKQNMSQAVIGEITGVVDFALPGQAARMAWMDLTTLRRTLGTPDEATEVALRVPEGVDAEREKSRYLPLARPGESLQTWRELAGLLADAMRLQNLVFSATIAIVFAIVISSIVNTSLMTVMERTKEIGALMAMGYRRRHILSLFLCESAIIGMLGGVLGAAAAAVGISIAGRTGIRISFPGQSVSTVLHPSISAGYCLMVFFLAISAALIAGFLPAWRASKMRPVEALSSN